MATAVQSTAAPATTQTSASGGRAAAGFGGDFNTFLTLLTTQLKNQSPLDPLDTNQFTQQLVQFAGVEQQLKSNDTLSSILTAMRSSSTSNAASYIGMKVTADGSTAPLAKGAATWTVNAAKDTKRATVTISNADGAAVATKSMAFKAGAQAFAWDGRDASGSVQPDGDYRIAITALDATGQSVVVSTELSGTVSAVDVSSGSPTLTVGSSSIPLSKVKTIAYQ